MRVRVGAHHIDCQYSSERWLSSTACLWRGNEQLEVSPSQARELAAMVEPACEAWHTVATQELEGVRQLPTFVAAGIGEA